MKMVLLKTGKCVPDFMVRGTLLELRREIKNNPLAIFELVKLCQDKNYKLHENWVEELGNPGLVLPNGKPQSDVREIVLASVEGEGMEMIFYSPLHEREKGLKEKLWDEDICVSSSEYWEEGWTNE